MTFPLLLRHHILCRVALSSDSQTLSRNNFVPFLRWRNRQGQQLQQQRQQQHRGYLIDKFTKNLFGVGSLATFSAFHKRFISTSGGQRAQLDQTTTAASTPDLSEEEEYDSSSSSPLLSHGAKGRSFSKKRALLHPKYSLTPEGRFLQPVRGGSGGRGRE